MEASVRQSGGAPARPGLGELIGRLLGEARSLVADYAELAVLDARRAAIRLAWLLGAVLVAAVLVVTTWMALVAAGRGADARPGRVLGHRARRRRGAQRRGAGALAWWMLALIKELPFTALLRQLRGERPAETRNDSSRPGDLRSRAAHRPAAHAAQARGREAKHARGAGARFAGGAVAAAALGFVAADAFARSAGASRRIPERRKSDHIKAAKATGFAGLLTTAAMWFVRAQWGSPVQARAGAAARNSRVEKRRRRLAATRATCREHCGAARSYSGDIHTRGGTLVSPR